MEKLSQFLRFFGSQLTTAISTGNNTISDDDDDG